HGIGGLLGHDGRPPAELYALGREELATYPSVTVRDGEVVAGAHDGEGFALTLADGTVARARRVVLATGMDYRFPDLEGAAERWGETVFHCPFCHGWEVQGQPLGVLDDGPSGVHRALLLSMWSDDVTLLTNGPTQLTDDERAQLDHAGVAVDEREVARLTGAAPRLDGVAFADGSARPLGGLLVPIALHQRSALADQLGATPADGNPLAPAPVAVDAVQRTAAEGIVAAGDVTADMPSVSNAVAAGMRAAAAVVQSLAAERGSTPVAVVAGAAPSEA
ncbi:MAG TPA: NAD(P)/FAD-dependent oxidoreductase, partial [Solirubrobacteraceae bacterium]|nr:NAD(P)/FAD-dependent oxidoreductase [Solirubrobacteraceae bacterium]